MGEGALPFWEVGGGGEAEAEVEGGGAGAEVGEARPLSTGESKDARLPLSPSASPALLPVLGPASMLALRALPREAATSASSDEKDPRPAFFNSRTSSFFSALSWHIFFSWLLHDDWMG